jgi:tetratricopeptide (TPR) repeat protein
MLWGVLALGGPSPGDGEAWGRPPDRIRLLERGREVTGTVSAVSPDAVELADPQTGGSRSIAIQDIRAILFGGEPDALRAARTLLERKDGAGALEELAKLDRLDPLESEDASEFVGPEIDYVRAAAMARHSLADGDQAAAAEQHLRGFLLRHAGSHRFYAAQESLGELLGRIGRHAEADAAYAQLDAGPPAFRVRSATARARLLHDQGRHAEAIERYDAAMAIELDPRDEAGARQKREAVVGRARCLARTGRADAAVDQLREVIRNTDPDDVAMMARAYNALGDAHRGRPDGDQDAMIAYLTVDLVYATDAESHAEALANLVNLWQKAGNPERAREARQQLEAAYPGSRWARDLTAGAAS